jgi:hypothetical protein
MGLCSIMADSNVDMELWERCLLVRLQKDPRTELGMAPPGEDRPICGSCWPLYGLRSLGMFMPLLKLQKGCRSSLWSALGVTGERSATITCLS